MHIAGSFTFQTIDRGGSRVFSAIRIRKSADLIPDAYKCVFGKGGVCYFSHPDGGGHAILSSRNRGIDFFFSYSEALSPTPPPSAEIFEQSLILRF